MRRLVFICCLLAAATAARAVAPLGRWDLPPDRGIGTVLLADDTRALVGADDTDGHVPGGWLWVLDLSDPTVPIQRAEFPLADVPTDIAVAGDLAAVVGYHALDHSGSLVLVDLADPLQPEIVSESSFSGEPTAVAWLPPYAAIAVRSSYEGWLLVVDATDPAHPTTTDIMSLVAAPSTMTQDEGRLFLFEETDYSGIIEALDTTDPTAVTQIDLWGLTLRFAALDVRDDRLHALHEGGTYVLIDTSGPGLWFRGVVELPYPPGGLTHQGDVVYTATGDSLTVIGAGDPDHPFIADVHEVDAARDVDLGRGYCALLDASGLWTLPPYEGPTPVTVSGFAATVEGDGVTLRWEAPAHAPGDFELQGALSGRAWTLDVTGGPDGTFTAHHVLPVVGEIQYLLFLREGTQRVPVGETTVQILPSAVKLADPFPNPFNPRVTIAYELPRPVPISLTVHDARGRRVAILADGIVPAGPHTATWTGLDDAGKPVPSGTYHFRLEVEGETSIRRATLLR